MSASLPDPDELFRDHLDYQLARYAEALEACGHDALLIAAGEPGHHFLDDIEVSFKPNPHFRLFVPMPAVAGSSLLLRPGRRPVLLHYRPEDYWHLPPAPAAGSWTESFEIHEVGSQEEQQRAQDAALAGVNHLAVIAPGSQAPEPLLCRLDFGRARKTAYEIACMRLANVRAARGHRAARDAFFAGASEFAIHLAYLAATEHEDADLPYGNIIALDDHGAVLHYQHRERRAPPGGSRSFLIDAGASARGYAADVTRTYSAAAGAFADLITAMDAAQQQLVAEVRAGVDFVDLHRAAHHAVASVLRDADLAVGSPEALVETGVTAGFLPHGLGHLIGIQTHDVGGRMQDAQGSVRLPPEAFPALRLTRTLEPDFVVTIEPGLYFIPMLLDELRSRPEGRAVAWDAVDALRPYGGIRIEDDVRVTGSGSENLTRPALAAEGIA